MDSSRLSYLRNRFGIDISVSSKIRFRRCVCCGCWFYGCRSRCPACLFMSQFKKEGDK